MLLRRLKVAVSALALALGTYWFGFHPAEPPPSPVAEPALRVAGSADVLPLVQKLADAYGREYSEARVTFSTRSGSADLTRAIADGTLDLAVLNSPLAEPGLGLRYRAIGQDALAFAVRLPNPLHGLSSGQARDVYDGSLTTWRGLNGPETRIMVLDREADEPIRRLGLVPFMDGRPVAARSVVLAEARDMILGLASTPNSIGYASLALLRIEPPPNVRILAVDGIMPSAESLARATYSWHLTLGVVHRDDPRPATGRFLDFVRGPGGRHVLEQYDVAAADS